MILTLTRTRPLADRVLGVMTAEGPTVSGKLATGHLCFTLEDTDRHLEDNPGAKIRGSTAIPTGKYGLCRTWSPHLKRKVVMLLGVPTHGRVYLHEGTKPADTLGCILVGLLLKGENVANCAGIVRWLETEVPLGGEKDPPQSWIIVVRSQILAG